jgi:hypothetical protein
MGAELGLRPSGAGRSKCVVKGQSGMRAVSRALRAGLKFDS